MTIYATKQIQAILEEFACQLMKNTEICEQLEHMHPDEARILVKPIIDNMDKFITDTYDERTDLITGGLTPEDAYNLTSY